MANEYDDFEVIRALHEEVEREAIDRINSTIRRLRDEYEPRIESALLSNDTVLVVTLGDELSEALGRAVADAFEQAYLNAARTASKGLRDGLQVEVGFSAIKPRALDYIDGNTARLVREVSDNQRLAIQNVLRDATARGINPKQAAKELTDVVGLTARQERAVSNYRRLLERSSTEALDRALRDQSFDEILRAGRLTQADIDRMVDAYRRNYLRYRTEMIARTEMMSAANEGVEEAYKQAFESGAMDIYEWIREWWTSRDERVRHSHRPMHGQLRGVDEKFRSGAGNLLQYPQDPSAPGDERIQCRCKVATRFRAIVENERNTDVGAEV